MLSFPLLYLQEGPPLSLTLILLCFCLLFSLVIGVLILGFVVRKENAANPTNPDEEKNDKI